MQGKILISLGIAAIFVFGFFAARLDLDEIFSKTIAEVFGFKSAGGPALEISLRGGEEVAEVKRSGAGDGGKSGTRIFPRNLAVVLSPTIAPSVSEKKDETKTASAASSAPAAFFLPPDAGAESGKININTARHEELQKITGVGPVLAQRIIDYRSQNGAFLATENITKVNGIGDATFEKMKDEITVGNVAPPAASSGQSSAPTTTAPVYYTVSVSMQEDGFGKVASNPAGINCGFDCAEDFPAGTKVVLTATPEANSFFGGWLEACTGNGDCILNVSSSRLAAVAAFRLIASTQSAPPPPAETAPAAGKILISELFYDAVGSDDGKEFVELYNTGTADADLSGWALRKSDGSPLAVIGGTTNDKVIIPAGRFFLVGFSSYSGNPAADIVRSASLAHTTTTTVGLYDASGVLVESVTYPVSCSGCSISNGQSYERQPLTESGQFAIQPNPNPQNSGL